MKVKKKDWFYFVCFCNKFMLIIIVLMIKDELRLYNKENVFGSKFNVYDCIFSFNDYD